ncbi:Putative E3 ubiquitin-protein ligase HERC5 [Heterocephalus glaber]|uniref:Putative E3 ubiquitin-protein ligase HERC5 n=1 Tax=Heterocephalus glaber TaxID=10181 RepID=G5BZ76_HETGA|nr:Putative E3 ubiquitin-protein ligase HERC5 [Heterocephalus glaber]
MKIHSMDQGAEHLLVLSSDGKAFEYSYSMEPARFQSILQEKGIIQIACGDYHSLALSKVTDSPSLVEVPDNQKVECVACGGAHTALLTQDGLMFTFGAGKYGQLGHNSTKNELRPRLVTELSGNRVTQIACGRWHTLAYASDLDKVFSFGFGEEGQLGNGGKHNQLIPLPVKSPSNEDLQFESHCSGKELIMIAGGNQSILLWIDKKNSYVNLRRKILTLNEGTVKRWIGDVGTKHWQNTKRVAAETMSIHLDLNKTRSTFKELTQKDWITNMITTCLRDNLLKKLPFHSPHQEALEVFILLPECPVMHDFNNWESLVVPFAEMICKMSDQSLGVLEEHWGTLQESAFRNLVQMFKTAISSQLHYWSESDVNNGHMKTLLEILKRLHRVNQTKHHLPEKIFKVDELTDWLNFYGEAYRRSTWKMNLEKKLTACLAGIVEQEESELTFMPTFDLKVRRRHLIEDVLNQLSRFENEDLRRELWVSFSGEIGYNLEGVKTEFFYCLFEEMTRPEYGMFTYPEDASYMWFPVRPKFEKKRYFFFGILCGLSLFNCNVANIPFPLALFKKLLNQMPSLEDLKELSPGLGKSLQALMDDEGRDFGEVYYIYFNVVHLCLQVHWDRHDRDLVPNGSGIPVNQTNKKDYVSKCVDYIFNISIKAIYDEFQRGFYKVCDKEIIGVFHPEELRDVIVGNTDYDWETFEKNASYEEGYNNSHPTIVMFWEALRKLTLEEKKKFLVFLTGTDRLQIKDKTMKIRFCCPENLNEEDPMTAQSCFSVLYLPKYSTMERVEEALQVAINNTRGFG